MARMLLHRVAPLLFLFLCQAKALPLANQLTEEDEKVTKCITEILADTLSKPSPVPVTGECLKILREDERVLAMLHHQHLLTELEDLARQENMKHRLGQEDSHDAWEREHEELKKREERPSRQREAATSEKTQERDGEWKEEGQGLKEYQKTEKIEENVKEVSHGEDNQEALEEAAAKAEMEDEGEEEGLRKKKRTSSETWSSQEYFGLAKNRGSEGLKIRKGMLRGSQDSLKRSGSDKRSFELEGEEEEEDDSSEEKPRSHHRGGHHHEDWEDEEEGGEKRRRADLAKRVAEKASNEETAQFEEEEKGMKISNSKGHLHGGWKPWPEEEQEQEEEEEEGEMRYGHHHRPAALDLKKRHREEYPKGRHHGDEEDEGERETSLNEAQELEKLEEIERDLQKAVEKLLELRKGSSLPPHHGQI